MAKTFVKNLSEATLIGIAMAYAKDGATLSSVGEIYKLSPTMVSNAMYRSISEDIIGDALANNIIEKIVNVKEVGRFQRKQRWNKALEEREALRKEILKAKVPVSLESCLAKEQELIHQISTYDDTLYLDPDAPSLSELESDLKLIQDQIQELQNN